ncbi:MAG: AraC family transcriptional regulator [Ekhidna sp.]|uniref:AraC family transcriptional regulator n=1 Tax=Ekhidna sp. TaxID=2608089 RepID=UPI0032F0306F
MKKQIIKDDELIRVTQTHYEKGLHMPPHTHEFSAISLILKGGFQELIDGDSREVCRAKTLIKPAHVLHSDHYDDDCSILCIYLKDESIIDTKARDVLKEWTGMYGINWNTFQPYFNTESLKERKQIINSFLAHLGTSKNASDEIPEWIYHIKSYLDLNFTQNIQTSELADKYGIHPVYLARVFRKYYGLSIKDYIKSLRIRNSIASIFEKKQSLSQIAVGNGFADQSHFIRNFKQEVGTTPKGFKKIIA